MPRVLLTGASGFLGRYLARELGERGHPWISAGRSPRDDLRLDLDDPESPPRVVREARCDLVLHAAAMTSIAGCEAEPRRAERVNHLAVEALAEEAGRRLVFVSTDLVFAGDEAPYSAAAPTRPLSTYGRTKADAEAAVQASGGRVIRIPLLFGPSADGRRGASDMIRHAAGAVRLFSNEVRTPLHAADAARGILDLAFDAGGASVLHVAGREAVSRLELGRRFVLAAGLGVVLEEAESTDPRRPRDVSLLSDWDCGRSLEEALAAC